MPADVNSVNEEIRNEAKKVLESKTGMEKVKYFVYYYKWWVIGIAIAGLIVGSLVYDFATRKESVFQVVVCNGEYSENYDYNSLIDGFAEGIEYDHDKQEVTIDSSIHVDVHATDQTSQVTIQKVFLYITAQDLDVLLCDKDLVDLACGQDCGTNMEEVLPADMLEKYRDDLYWFDTAVIVANDFVEPEEAQAEVAKIKEEDRYKAFAINVSDFYKVKETKMFPYTDGEAYVLIPANTKHLDYAIDFLRYLDQP